LIKLIKETLTGRYTLGGSLYKGFCLNSLSIKVDLIITKHLRKHFRWNKFKQYVVYWFYIFLITLICEQLNYKTKLLWPLAFIFVLI